MIDTTAAARLRSFVERIERLNEEKKALADDIAAVFAEAKADGFDVKAMRELLKRRGMDQSEIQERDAILDLYMSALGMAKEGGG